MSPVPMARVSDAFTLTDAPGVNTKPALWQAEVRPMILSFVVASVAGGIVAWTLIFPIPAFFGAAVTACLIVAFFASGR